jgi:hypothetical protein
LSNGYHDQNNYQLKRVFEKIQCDRFHFTFFHSHRSKAQNENATTGVALVLSFAATAENLPVL